LHLEVPIYLVFMVLRNFLCTFLYIVLVSASKYYHPAAWRRVGRTWGFKPELPSSPRIQFRQRRGALSTRGSGLLIIQASTTSMVH